MRTIQKIKKLAVAGRLPEAMKLAIHSTRDEASLKEKLYLQRKALVKLKRKYSNQLVGETEYKRELNDIINRFLATVQELSKNPKLLKSTGIWTKWWFWPLLLLLAWWAYRYFNQPPPPPTRVSVTFQNARFVLSSGDDIQLKNAIDELNQLQAQKQSLLTALQMPVEPTLLQFNTTEEKMKDTLDYWHNNYRQYIDQLKTNLLQRHSGYHIYFNPNEATIPESAREKLLAIRQALDLGFFHLQINGYTDEVGSEEENQMLSCARAQAAKNYLVTLLPDRTALPVETIQINCKGELRVAAANSQDSWRKRRVELWLEKIGD